MATLDEILTEYASWPDKGLPDGDGSRVTALYVAAETPFMSGQPFNIYHVFEAVSGAVSVHVMGPKPVYGEWLDGSPYTPAGPPGEELAPGLYDGRVFTGPATDANYEPVVYTLGAGSYSIEWIPVGTLVSNTLLVDVF